MKRKEPEAETKESFETKENGKGIDEETTKLIDILLNSNKEEEHGGTTKYFGSDKNGPEITTEQKKGQQEEGEGEEKEKDPLVYDDEGDLLEVYLSEKQKEEQKGKDKSQKETPTTPESTGNKPNKSKEAKYKF
eukprot:TRINITY_DN5411_c0_g1_i1.p1 TRINITY_DN5411_c0_g1~~TRINITY_DN5411_c0_g1_i1.p1  ORF type:complete len:134 (+),score=58.74 TRINITY_DN5411_c0_g1_i1:87-488(+)